MILCTLNNHPEHDHMSKNTFLHLIRCIVAVTIFSFAIPQAWAAFDINTATAAQIQENMEGVGEKKAKAIVAFRKKNGRFKSADDLLQVPGVGKKTVEKNKNSFKNLKSGSNKDKAKKEAKKKGEKTPKAKDINQKEELAKAKKEKAKKIKADKKKAKADKKAAAKLTSKDKK